MNSNTKQHRHTNIFVRLSIVSLLLLVILAPINAQSFRSTSMYRLDNPSAELQNTTMMTNSISYTVSETGVADPYSNYEGDVDLGDWGDPDIENPGDQSDEYPLGDAWVMLLFAAAAAIVIALRKKQTA